MFPLVRPSTSFLPSSPLPLPFPPTIRAVVTGGKRRRTNAKIIFKLIQVKERAAVPRQEGKSQCKGDHFENSLRCESAKSANERIREVEEGRNGNNKLETQFKKQN